MLRAAVIAATAMLACAAVALIARGMYRPGWELLAIALIVLVGTLFERWRYRRVDGRRPAGPWQSTRERFIDPSTGEAVEVLFNPETGERHYLRTPQPDRTEPPA